MLHEFDSAPVLATAETGAFLEPSIGRTVLRALDRSHHIDLGDVLPGEHVSGLLDVEDREHLVRITEPVDGSRETIHTVIMLPGFTESVEDGTAFGFHNALARELPDVRFVSIATDGVGGHSMPLSLKDGWDLTFETMAADRLALAERIAAGGPVSFLTVSMGSIIGLKAVLQNIETEQIDLRQVINHSHAQVPPERVIRDMLVRFPHHILLQNWLEGPRHPASLFRQAIGSIAMVASRTGSIAGNVRNMAQGTAVSDMLYAAANVPTVYISGPSDPLSQPDVLARLQKEYPGNVTVVWVPGLGKGHYATMDASREAKRVAQHMIRT